MTRIARVGLALALVLSLAPAARADDRVENVKKLMKEVEEYLRVPSPARAKVALEKVEKAATALGEFGKDKLESDLVSLREGVENAFKEKDADRYMKRLERAVISGIENDIRSEQGSNTGSSDQTTEYFKGKMELFELIITDDFNKQVLGPDTIGKLARKKDYFQKEFTAAQLAANVKYANGYLDKIEKQLGSKENTYTDTYEQQFKYVDDLLAKCPKDDATVKKSRERQVSLRGKFEGAVKQGARDSTVLPAVTYWKECKENYGKECAGWDSENTPNSFEIYTKHSPAVLGCPKTERLLGEVLGRWLDSDMVKKAQEQYGSDPDFKPCWDEATKWREVAIAKVVKFANTIVDEAEKETDERRRMDVLSTLQNSLTYSLRPCKGPEADKILARIAVLEKKWKGDKEAGEQAKKDLDARCSKATNEVWPDLCSDWKDKAKKIDANAAIADIGAWKGTVLHFWGGSRGVNMNRSGWDFGGDFFFVVSQDGIPICGNMDDDLWEAIQAVRKQTGLEDEGVEECYGIVEGTCKVPPLIRIGNEIINGSAVEGIRMRIVAVKMVNAAAALGKGTNLAKVDGMKEISVGSGGSSSSRGSGGGGSGGGVAGGLLKWLFAFGETGLAMIVGLLAIAIGASRFVQPIEDLRVKAGNYLGYAGIGFVLFTGIWALYTLVYQDFLPMAATGFAAAFVASDVLRARGIIQEDLATKIRPVGIVLGLGACGLGFLHLIFWGHNFI